MTTLWRILSLLGCALVGGCVVTGSTRDVLVLQVSAGEGRAGLDQALEDVRSALAERPDRDVEAVLSEGVWTLGSPLEFGPRDGGGDRATVTWTCLLYTSPSPRDKRQSRMPSSA